MLVPNKDPHIIAAEKLLADADEAATHLDYERVASLASLAQAHIAISRHEAGIEAAIDVTERLVTISEALEETAVPKP